MLRKVGYGLDAAKAFFEHNPEALKWIPDKQKTKCIVTYAKYGDEIRKEVRSGSKVVTGFFSPKGKQVNLQTYNGEIKTSFEDGYKVTEASSHNFKGKNPILMEELTLSEPTIMLNESKFYYNQDLGHNQALRFIEQGGKMKPTPMGGGTVNSNGIIWPERRTNGLYIEELDMLHEPNPLNGIPNSSVSVGRFAEGGDYTTYYSSQNQYLGEMPNPDRSPASMFKALIDWIKDV